LWAIQPTCREVTDFKKAVSQRVKTLQENSTKFEIVIKHVCWDQDKSFNERNRNIKKTAFVDWAHFGKADSYSADFNLFVSPSKC
jgi:hypothetical protein